jgi:hypothetical protein
MPMFSKVLRAITPNVTLAWSSAGPVIGPAVTRQTRIGLCIAYFRNLMVFNKKIAIQNSDRGPCDETSLFTVVCLQVGTWDTSAKHTVLS